MKKITCFVLAIILAFSMAACTKSSADAPAADTNNVTGKEKDFTIVYVGGETSSPWYLQVEKGMNEWAKSTGMNGSFRGTASSDPTEAVSLIKDLTAQKVDAILVGVDCQDAVEPALADARAAGILVVSTEGTGMTNIDFDVEPCNNSYYGQYMMQQLAEMMGKKGTYVVMVGDLTSTSHNAWADAAIEYQKEKYPDMTLIDERLESQVNAEVAYEKAKEILKKYPDLGGILGCSSFCPLGSAKAVAELGLDTKVFGNGTMLTCEAALRDHTLQAITFWDPALTAQAMANLAVMVLENGKDAVKDGVDLGCEGYTSVVMDAERSNVLYGAALVYGTLENFEEYPF